MKPTRIRIAAALALGLASALGAQPNVIRVPDRYPTIQQALLAAAPGTLILVKPGSYPENLFWPRTEGIRLLAIEGPGRTILDGGGLGRVVQFPIGLGRATVLEGFTITNGHDRDGAGVRIFSSPTLRHNRIVNNRGSDSQDNRGGGVSIVGGSPWLECNIIQGNSCMGGLQAFGGGVFVTGGAAPFLVGNQILGNTCQGVFEAAGGGVHVDEAAPATATLISNTVAGNLCTSSSSGRGGGVSVGSGPVALLNNTVARNGISGVGVPRGGGVHVAATARDGSRLVNNIVVSSTAGGGIYVEAGRPGLDFNDVWQNSGGDYVGVGPGPNDRSVDPGFASAGDYHLAPTSPLIDAGLDLVEVRSAGVDLDGDPRLVDGNLDGLQGNAARVDIGADEFNAARLAAFGLPWVGGSVVFDVTGPAGFDAYLFAGATSSNVLIQPLGLLRVGPAPWLLAGSKPVPSHDVIVIPGSVFLVGLEVHIQAVVLGPGSGPLLGSFTNATRLTLLDPVRTVAEYFLDTKQLDPGPTTADWTRGTKHGLHATVGYGGTGADGVLDLGGNLVLDSSTRTPGADGVVEWNYQSVHIRPGGNLRLTGNRPIRIRVQGSCLIEGTIDAGGHNGLSGPAGTAIQVGQIPGGPGGPGAGAGGDANTNPANPIGALPMELRGGPGWPRVINRCGDPNRSDNRLITVIEENCGGGVGGNRGTPSGTLLRNGCSGNGGGHLQDGMEGDYLCMNIGAFGREFGRKWIVPTGANEVPGLTAGTGGGAGGNAVISTTNPVPSQDIVAGSGGGGGGGVELECFENVVLKAAGRVLARGGSGGQGYTTLVAATTVAGGWGAGGSGGSVWLSATSVTVESGGAIDARGGIGNPNPPHPTRTGTGGDGYIILRDRGGDPTVQSGAVVTPAPLAPRFLYDPPSNGKSEAYSRFYDSGTTSPQWAFDSNDRQTGLVRPGADLLFGVAPVAGQTVHIAFQGAPDVNGVPHWNPAHWYPPGNTTQNPNAVFEPDIDKLRLQGGLRYVRFRIQFDLGKREEGKPPQNPIGVTRLMLRY
ncbi:MAG: hypothetical protein JXQ29_01550 [Planctomycetes bacterium]|nr:hypothetical protein [Planctomycetota bacterium]